MQGITFSDTLEQSFTGALGVNPDIKVVGSGYSNFDIEAAKTLTETALKDYSDLNTVVCLDPVSAEGVLEVLNTNGFAGTLVCFTEEGMMNEMTALTPGSTTVTYGYFPASDTAYTAVNALLELMGGSTSPQVYYLTPYTY
jgi:ABC-type sugar transport system substrate-binding protein